MLKDESINTLEVTWDMVTYKINHYLILILIKIIYEVGDFHFKESKQEKKERYEIQWFKQKNYIALCFTFQKLLNLNFESGFVLFYNYIYSCIHWKCFPYLIINSTFIIEKSTVHKFIIPCQYETIWCQILCSGVTF